MSRYLFRYENRSNYGNTGKSIDYWGYYNGTPNTDLVPRQEIQMGLPYPLPSGQTGKATIGEAYREPSLIGVRHTLSEITHPTGLRDTFTYELHRYKDPKTDLLKDAGGFRIRFIKSYDKEHKLIKKKEFRYGDKGEGHIWIPPYLELFQQDYTKEYRSTGGVLNSRRYRVFGSQPVITLSNSSGAPVMYSKITEISGDGRDSIKTIYYYNCYTNYSLTGAGYIMKFNFDYIEEWDRNQFLRKEEYAFLPGGGRVIQKEENSYVIYTVPESSSNMNSTKVGLAYDDKVIVSVDNSYYDISVRNFTRYFYDITGNKSSLQYTKKETSYGYNGLESLTKETKMEYGTTEYDVRTAQPVKVTTVASDGAVNTVEYAYPYHRTTSSAAQKMVAQNDLTRPLEENHKTIRNNVVTAEQKAVFAYQDAFCGFLPYKLTSLQTNDVQTNALRDVERYILYDSQGNVTEYINKDGTTVTVLWGYNYQRVIAEIEGANYSGVIASLGYSYLQLQSMTESSLQIAFQTLRSKNIGLVTSYTYYPSRSLSTLTDPRNMTTYFTYDGTGRLTETYIRVNGVKQTVSSNQYHFTQP